MQWGRSRNTFRFNSNGNLHLRFSMDWFRLRFRPCCTQLIRWPFLKLGNFQLFQRKHSRSNICSLFPWSNRGSDMNVIRRERKSNELFYVVVFSFHFVRKNFFFTARPQLGSHSTNELDGFTILPSFETCIYGKERKNKSRRFFLCAGPSKTFLLILNDFVCESKGISCTDTLWATKDEKLKHRRRHRPSKRMHYRLLTSFLFNNANARRSFFLLLLLRLWIKVPTRKW